MLLRKSSVLQWLQAVGGGWQGSRACCAGSCRLVGLGISGHRASARRSLSPQVQPSWRRSHCLFAVFLKAAQCCGFAFLIRRFYQHPKDRDAGEEQTPKGDGCCFKLHKPAPKASQACTAPCRQSPPPPIRACSCSSPHHLQKEHRHLWEWGDHNESITIAECSGLVSSIPRTLQDFRLHPVRSHELLPDVPCK